MDGKSAAAPAAIVSGKASVKAGILAVGTHTVVAAYSGDKYHSPSKASEKITVGTGGGVLGSELPGYGHAESRGAQPERK